MPSAGVKVKGMLLDKSLDLIQCFLDRHQAGVVGSEAAKLGVFDLLVEELNLSVGHFTNEVAEPIEEGVRKSHDVSSIGAMTAI